jgi:dienelactone hydrolase
MRGAWRALRGDERADAALLADSDAEFCEFPAARGDYRARDGLLTIRLAVAGASMGGMTALGIMTHHPELKASPA